MHELHLDRLLLLTLISSIVHQKFSAPSPSPQNEEITTYDPLPEPPVPTVSLLAPVPIPTHAPVAPQQPITPHQPITSQQPLPPLLTAVPETRHTLYDTLSLILPLLLKLGDSPIFRVLLLAMSFWEKLNRKLRSLKELRAGCRSVLRLGMSLLVMLYPVGGIEDVGEVWDSVVARKRRGGKVFFCENRKDEGNSESGLEEMSMGIAGRRKGGALARLAVKTGREVKEARFFASPLGSREEKGDYVGYGKTVMDVDLPVACPPTV